MIERKSHPDLESLRAWRVRSHCGVTLADEVDRLGRYVERTGKRLGEFIDAWEEMVPPEIRNATRVASYRAGTFSVVAESSGVLYEVDRMLREGLEAALRRRVKGTLARVRLSVGPMHDPALSSGSKPRFPVS